MEQMNPTVLIVEDDPMIARALCKLLQQEGLTPIHASTLAEGRKAYRAEHPSLFILDVNLPDGLGFELCRQVREEDGTVPIFFLTARSDEDTAVKGLSVGACDFIRKPFSGQELVLRIRKALRIAPSRVSVGPLIVDRGKKQVFWEGQAVTMPRAEFEVLSLLAERAGNVVTHPMIVERINPDGEMLESSVKSHVSRLKSKLNKVNADALLIETVYGQGYRLTRKANE